MAKAGVSYSIKLAAAAASGFAAFRLEFIPHLMRGRNDEKMCFLTFAVKMHSFDNLFYV